MFAGENLNSLIVYRYVYIDVFGGLCVFCNMSLIFHYFLNLESGATEGILKWGGGAHCKSLTFSPS